MFSYCRVCAIYKELKVLPLLEVSLDIFSTDFSLFRLSSRGLPVVHRYPGMHMYLS